ncbi:M-phase inducer phosphatase 3 isoform X3 [Homo sapiens]|uniref:M-phase inducer phosphatase 3 isoform X3 n=1 Tax=Homo sapiens TaxID=9606 RepID=UPI0005CFFFDD|nr:M-phase inducer phosphatase 3 isoform X3 [Homo sapiens]XP_054209898.1 M-phase inducer phosphatase 3 isoform X3 [Homo sapiens]|eukprot:XP_011542062.1 M-phase inducer phosphatase 3 isoform X3 [Homo sapiens]
MEGAAPCRVSLKVSLGQRCWERAWRFDLGMGVVSSLTSHPLQNIAESGRPQLEAHLETRGGGHVGRRFCFSPGENSKTMSTELFSSTREEGSSGSGPSFRSNQRKMLNLLLERDTSFTVCPDVPRTPVGKFLGDSANLSILSGGTPKRCLDLSNLSSGEITATQLTTSADLDETGHLDSSGLQEVHLAGMNHDQHLMKCSPAQLLCSTPNGLDRGHRKRDAMCSSSANKENDNGNLVDSEMKYLGSPITTVPKLDKNPNLGEDQAEEISDELMEFSLKDQEAKVSRSGLYRSPSMPENLNRPRLKQVEKFKDNTIPDKVKKKYFSGQGKLRKVAALLSGKFQGLIEKFYVIDCRYPYEYLGGHIQGALNLYSQEELFNFFLKKPIVPLDTQKRIIIVFHCEFSSERGPRMCRCLREEDRSLNQYPALYYPELYILKGGYRDFFPEYMELCEPQSYCPMHHQDHKTELLRCRSQSKVQEGERQLREQIALLVKDMSP